MYEKTIIKLAVDIEKRKDGQGKGREAERAKETGEAKRKEISKISPKKPKKRYLCRG